MDINLSFFFEYLNKQRMQQAKNFWLKKKKMIKCIWKVK